MAAGPWSQPPGTLYTRSSVSWGEVNKDVVTRVDLHSEYGLRQGWTLTFKGEAEYRAQSDHVSGYNARLTSRHTLYQSEHIVVSLEAGLQTRTKHLWDGFCDRAEYEIRGGGAWQRSGRGRSLFVYAEAALLYQTACQRHKVELGLNYPLSAKLSLLTQIWSERGAPYSLSDKIQTELIWHRPLLDLSLGYRAEHSGAFDEQALVFAMASRF